MKLKVCIFLNRVMVPYADDFESARLYFLKHGIELEYNFLAVDVHGYASYSSHTIYGAQRFILAGAESLVTLDFTADITIFAFDQNEWANPPGSQYPLRPETPTGSCILVANKPFINLPTYAYDHNDGQTIIMIKHELMHALVKMANLKGFPVPDIMDTYYLNSFPDNINSNFGQEWAYLKPFLSPIGAIIKRGIMDSYETMGILTAVNNGLTFTCKTLERPLKNNLPNISSIPAGSYQCKYTFSLRMLKYTYELQNVKGRTGIRIHAANFITDLLGCIALGDSFSDINKDGELDIINSKVTIQRFEDFMQHQEFPLTII